MNIKSIVELFNRKNDKADNIVKQINKNNKEVAQEILKELGNSTTKIVFDKDIKNCYYVFLNDTIYLADNNDNKNGYYRFCLIAHECRHSIQSKIMQKLNFILSNIELVFFAILFIINFFIVNTTIPFYIYLSLAIISAIVRLILEIDACKESINISKNYLSKHLEKSNCDYVCNIYKEKINKMLPLSIIPLFFSKIIRIVVLFILTFFI